MCSPPLAKPAAGVPLHPVGKLKKEGTILSPNPVFYSKPGSQVALQTTSEPACLGPANTLLAMSERSPCPLSAAALGGYCLLDEGILITQACLSFPPFLPSSVRVANVPVHLCAVGFKGLKVLINWSSTCRPLQPEFPHMSLGMYLPWSREQIPRICFACWAVSLKRWEKRGVNAGFH